MEAVLAGAQSVASKRFIVHDQGDGAVEFKELRAKAEQHRTRPPGDALGSLFSVLLKAAGRRLCCRQRSR